MLNNEQYQQLLKPLNASRVAQRKQAGRNLSYLEAWDVKAHLIRIFGFGGWSWHVTSAELAFEDQKDDKWNVGYKVIGKLFIASLGCEYCEAAVGSATLPQRGEAHDMAVKTAESDALKRAAINLGTQFGLSLYDNGSLKDVVGTTLEREWVSGHDVQLSDEPEVRADSDGAEMWIEEMKAAVTDKEIETLLDIKKRLNAEDCNDLVYQGITLAKWLDKAIASVGK